MADNPIARDFAVVVVADEVWDLRVVYPAGFHSQSGCDVDAWTSVEESRREREAVDPGTIFFDDVQWWRAQDYWAWKGRY